MPKTKSISNVVPRLAFAGGAFLCALGAQAVAEGLDTSAFDRCKACHEVRNGDDVIVAGGRNGPNLFGAIGRVAGTLPDYNFSDGLVEAGKAGLVYDVDTLAAYAANPNGFLGEFLGGSARSKMPLGFPDYAEDAARFLAELQSD